MSPEAGALRAAIMQAFGTADAALRSLAAEYRTAGEADLPRIESAGQAADALRRLSLSAARAQTPPLDLGGYGLGFWARRQAERAAWLRRFDVRGQFVNRGPSARERRADEDLAHDTNPTAPWWAAD
jgi:hypothetical protein